MRVLHTSDWHLGARLCERDRIDEQEKFLDWLIELIGKHSVDILLISGDIFDSTNPPNAAERLYYNFLNSLKETCCSATVIIGGNHDSISKLNSPRALLRHLSVFVNGGVGDTPGDDVYYIEDEKERALAIICAVPFLRERDVHIPNAGESWLERDSAVIHGIKEYYSESLQKALSLKGQKEIPIIGMGHLFVTGSLSGTGQRDLYVGNLGALPVDLLPEEFDYTALGHIHRPQKISNKENVQYSGSPIFMDFGESGVKKIIQIDFEGSILKEITPIEIPVFKKLIHFTGDFDKICRNIEEFTFPETPFWADAEVFGGSAVGDISALLNEKAKEKGFEFLKIRILKADSDNIISSGDSIEIKDLTVEEVFIKRCKKSAIAEDEIKELLPLHNELLVAIQSKGELINEN